MDTTLTRKPMLGEAIPAPTLPTGVLQTNQPVAPKDFKPTPIVSSNTASTFINEKVVPTMDQARASIQKQLDDAKTQLAAKQAEEAANKKTITPVTKKEQTPEEKIADQPEPGNHYVYKADGSRLEVPVNVTAESAGIGFYDVDPTKEPIKPITDSTQDQYGNVYKRFDDGSIAQYDPSGNYKGPATEETYTASKQIKSVQDDIDRALKGSYPLKPWQTSMLEGLKTDYAARIEKQRVENANTEGGTTVAQNLYGLGNTKVGKDAITTVIQTGLKEVQRLQDEMASAVAKMEGAFQSDNYTMLKDAYTVFTDSQDKLQSNLDKINEAKAKADKEESEKQLKITTDNAIVEEFANGVKDPFNIMVALSKKGIQSTSEEVSKAIDNLTKSTGTDIDKLSGDLRDFFILKTTSPQSIPASITKLPEAQQAMAYVKLMKASSPESYYTNYAAKQSEREKVDQIKISTLLTNAPRDEIGYVTPEAFRNARAAWVADGHGGDTFDKTFSGYVNPMKAKDYGVNFMTKVSSATNWQDDLLKALETQ